MISNLKQWLFITLLFSAMMPAFGNGSDCPESWFELALPKNIKQCRVFGVKKPSTLSFFAVDSPENLVQFFLSNPNATQSRLPGEFTQVRLSQPDFIIFIYADGAGTQVNIRAERNP